MYESGQDSTREGWCHSIGDQTNRGGDGDLDEWEDDRFANQDEDLWVENDELRPISDLDLRGPEDDKGGGGTPVGNSEVLWSRGDDGSDSGSSYGNDVYGQLPYDEISSACQQLSSNFAPATRTVAMQALFSFSPGDILCSEHWPMVLASLQFALSDTILRNARLSAELHGRLFRAASPVQTGEVYMNIVSYLQQHHSVHSIINASSPEADEPWSVVAYIFRLVNAMQKEIPMFWLNYPDTLMDSILSSTCSMLRFDPLALPKPSPDSASPLLEDVCMAEVAAAVDPEAIWFVKWTYGSRPRALLFSHIQSTGLLTDVLRMFLAHFPLASSTAAPVMYRYPLLLHSMALLARSLSFFSGRAALSLALQNMPPSDVSLGITFQDVICKFVNVSISVGSDYHDARTLALKLLVDIAPQLSNTHLIRLCSPLLNGFDGAVAISEVMGAVVATTSPHMHAMLSCTCTSPCTSSPSPSAAALICNFLSALVTRTITYVAEQSNYAEVLRAAVNVVKHLLRSPSAWATGSMSASSCSSPSTHSAAYAMRRLVASFSDQLIASRDGNAGTGLDVGLIMEVLLDGAACCTSGAVTILEQGPHVLGLCVALAAQRLSATENRRPAPVHQYSALALANLLALAGTTGLDPVSRTGIRDAVAKQLTAVLEWEWEWEQSAVSSVDCIGGGASHSAPLFASVLGNMRALLLSACATGTAPSPATLDESLLSFIKRTTDTSIAPVDCITAWLMAIAPLAPSCLSFRWRLPQLCQHLLSPAPAEPDADSTPHALDERSMVQGFIRVGLKCMGGPSERLALPPLTPPTTTAVSSRPPLLRKLVAAHLEGLVGELRHIDGNLDREALMRTPMRQQQFPLRVHQPWVPPLVSDAIISGARTPEISGGAEAYPAQAGEEYSRIAPAAPTVAPHSTFWRRDVLPSPGMFKLCTLLAELAHASSGADLNTDEVWDMLGNLRNHPGASQVAASTLQLLMRTGEAQQVQRSLTPAHLNTYQGGATSTPSGGDKVEVEGVRGAKQCSQYAVSAGAISISEMKAFEVLLCDAYSMCMVALQNESVLKAKASPEKDDSSCVHGEFDTVYWMCVCATVCMMFRGDGALAKDFLRHWLTKRLAETRSALASSSSSSSFSSGVLLEALLQLDAQPVYGAFVASGISPSLMCGLWTSQCLWNFADWPDVAIFFLVHVALGPAGEACLLLSALRNAQDSILTSAASLDLHPSLLLSLSNPPVFLLTPQVLRTAGDLYKRHFMP
mmetsp:Transcript_14530/g.24027  ORF Transcript_14530/g.24027 Transcript_14530/m.24027 type:complete len:1252 (+) Transcript_14530:330-4085(+)